MLETQCTDIEIGRVIEAITIIVKQLQRAFSEIYEKFNSLPPETSMCIIGKSIWTQRSIVYTKDIRLYPMILFRKSESTAEKNIRPKLLLEDI